MTPHERAIAKEAVAQTLFELGIRVRPGSQDAWYKALGEYQSHRGIKAEIRELVREFPSLQAAKK